MDRDLMWNKLPVNVNNAQRIVVNSQPFYMFFVQNSCQVVLL